MTTPSSNSGTLKLCRALAAADEALITLESAERTFWTDQGYCAVRAGATRCSRCGGPTCLGPNASMSARCW